MSPRTNAPPANDASIWRRLMARAHPDAGGDHELFLFVTALKEQLVQQVCEGCRSRNGNATTEGQRPRPGATSQQDTADRIPYSRSMGEDFGDVTYRALSMADKLPYPFSEALSCLEDCAPSSVRYEKRSVGATYKQLAFIGHLLGMDKFDRGRWYGICRDIPLSEAHASHIINRLKEEAA